jgi:hypothetical protein
MSMKTIMVKTSSSSYLELSIMHIFFLKVMDIGLKISVMTFQILLLQSLQSMKQNKIKQRAWNQRLINRLLEVK